MVCGVSNYDYYLYPYGSNFYSPSVNNPFWQNRQNNPFCNLRNEKVGLWEGTKAFVRGLIKPVKNMIKHPIKSALFIAGTAALIIGTGGAATPLIIGAGLAMGTWMITKGTYNAVTSDTRGETLKALEDIGEGTFVLGSSVAGAKSYAASTASKGATISTANNSSFGSKACGYIEGLGKDTLTAIKAIPNSAKTTANMVVSGEFTGNLQSFLASSRLAAQHRHLAKLRSTKDPDYALAKEIYDNNVKAYKLKYGTIKPNKIANRYNNLYERFGFESTDVTGSKFINNPELARVSSIRALKNNLNIFKNLPEVNMAIGFNSDVNIDPEIQQEINSLAPYYFM